MHPAYSVLIFTTASGAGYGLLILLCLAGAVGMVSASLWLGLVGFGLSFGLVTAGLLASTFHLGHPERACRAMSQWRSSWLSREGVMAILTYAPAGLFAIADFGPKDSMFLGGIGTRGAIDTNLIRDVSVGGAIADLTIRRGGEELFAKVVDDVVVDDVIVKLDGEFI